MHESCESEVGGWLVGRAGGRVAGRDAPGVDAWSCTSKLFWIVTQDTLNVVTPPPHPPLGFQLGNATRKNAHNSCNGHSENVQVLTRDYGTKQE